MTPKEKVKKAIFDIVDMNEKLLRHPTHAMWKDVMTATCEIPKEDVYLALIELQCDRVITIGNTINSRFVAKGEIKEEVIEELINDVEE